MTRFPDSSGPFVPQETVGTNFFSPGKKWNGDPFAEPLFALPITSFSTTSTGHEIHLKWQVRAGQSYTVLRTTSVAEAFAPIGVPLQFSGENGEYTDVIGLSEAAFYLIRSP